VIQDDDARLHSQQTLTKGIDLFVFLGIW